MEKPLKEDTSEIGQILMRISKQQAENWVKIDKLRKKIEEISVGFREMAHDQNKNFHTNIKPT